jgi:hypothetical protein
MNYPDARRRTKDLEMMRSPDRWPQKNMLCLKRYVGLKPNGSMDRIDFATITYHQGAWIFRPNGGLEPKEGTDQMLQDLVHIGWMVD